jgi:dienelactone hydrolase
MLWVMKRAYLLLLSVPLAFAACESETRPPVSSSSTNSTGVGGASNVGATTTSTGGNLPVSRTDVTFTTSDGLNLTGYLAAGGPAVPNAPGVVLVHQFQQEDTQWGDLPEALVAAGYRTLAFNLRSHGDSDAYAGTFSDLLTDPNGAPLDVDAAIAFLTGEQGQADPLRIAIVGTSIGANLAVAAAIDGKAKAYIAISPRLAPTESLAGKNAEGMESVLYLAGELDTGGAQALDCQTMHDVTTPPRGIFIYQGTEDHGIAILANQSDSRGRVLDFLADNLP